MPRRTVLYQRVSTTDQKTDSQRECLRQWCKAQSPPLTSKDYILITDKASGRDNNRSGIQRVLRLAEKGKINRVICTKISRLSRSMSGGLEVLERLSKSGVQTVITEQGLTLGGNDISSSLVCNVLLAVSQFHRELISQNIKEGIAARKKKGHLVGRPVNHARREKIRALYEANVPVPKIAEQIGISRTAVYNSLARSRQDAA